MTLLERESHLAALGEYAAEARGGSGRLVLVAGEAGAGKTSLIEEAQKRIPAAWAWGVCDGLSTPRPLGPLRDLAPKLDGHLAGLARSGAARDDLFQATLDALGTRGEFRVVVIEDAHWADDATLDLVRFLGRRMRDLHALLIVSYRDDELGARLRRVLGGFAGGRGIRRIDVPPLSSAAVEKLAEGTEVDGAELSRTTGGNPFFVAAMLHGGQGDDPPSAVRDLVLSRAATLSAQARDVLDTAALIGRVVDVSLLQSATDASASTLDDALACGLLRTTPVAIRFGHELTRVIVDRAIAPHRRVSLERAILKALLEGGSTDSSVVAAHAVAAADDAAIIEYAVRAGAEAAALGSHREALAQYEQAWRHRRLLDERERALLLDAFGAEAVVVDRGPEAIAALEEAVTLWHRQGDALREGDAMTRLAHVLTRSARGAEGSAMAEAACALLEPLGPSAERARALALLTGLRMQQGRAAEAIEVGERAAALAARLDLPDVLADALDSMACAQIVLGAEWEPQMRRALSVAVAGGAHGQAARAFSNLAFGLCDQLRVDEAVVTLEEGTIYCEAHDDRTTAMCLRGMHAESLETKGEWDAALVVAEGVLSAAATELNRYGSLEVIGKILARRGDLQGAQLLERSLQLARDTAQPQYLAQSCVSSAEGRWLAGDLDGARTLMAEVVPLFAQLVPSHRRSIAVWAHRLLGLTLEAATTAPSEFECAGDPVAAAAGWDALGQPYEAGLALAFADDPDLLREAIARFERLGARSSADAVRRRMREQGHRGIPVGARAVTRANGAGLTAREQEVLGLLAASLSNEEIAQRLVISHRTVDHHVSAVLAKLGVDSRARAVTAAREAGLLVVA
ncbi:ATP-binding protein [Microbacterium sp.]|uniref:ATP-binding protein n=1 Tax=Microbacterium sp. TaxID=51671 RepID=UPI003A9230F7